MRESSPKGVSVYSFIPFMADAWAHHQIHIFTEDKQMTKIAMINCPFLAYYKFIIVEFSYIKKFERPAFLRAGLFVINL